MCCIVLVERAGLGRSRLFQPDLDLSPHIVPQALCVISACPTGVC